MEDSEMDDEQFVRVPFLVKIFGENVNKKFILSGQMMQIGRLPNSHIKINSVNVSRSHCTLNFVNGSWTIKDNNSQNGTFVNGRVLKKNQVAALQTGDIIFLGPPSENPQAFRYDDFLSEKEYKLLTSQTPTENKESSKENNSQPSTQSNSLIQSSVCSKSEDTKSTQEDTNKKNILASPRNKNCVKVPDLSKPMYTSDKKEQHSSKMPSKPVSVQVEDGSQSLLEMDSDDLCDQELHFSQNDSGITSEKSTVSKKMEKGSLQTKRHSEEDSENLKTKLALLSEKVKQLEESKSQLLKEYESVRNKDKMLDDALAEQRRLKEEMQMCETRVKNNVKTQIMEKLEEELICNICTEVLIKPTVLDCSHTFCEYCIIQWKKQKGVCPICRNKIKSQTRILALDDFIDKTLETLTPEQKEKRSVLIFQREQSKNKPKTPTGRRKRGRSRRYSNVSHRRHNRVPSQSVVIVEEINNAVQEVDIISTPRHRAGHTASTTAAAYSWVPDIFLSDNDNDSPMEVNLDD